MSDIDPIAKLAMTPRSQKEAGIEHFEWKGDDVRSVAVTVSMVLIFMVFATLLSLSI